jgi:hypothetical protein
MTTLRVATLISAALALSACDRSHGAASVQCQPRPSDERITVTLGGVVGNFGVQMEGVQIGQDCNTGIVVYLMPGQTHSHDVQLVATDNGKWFIVNVVGLGDVQLTEIK